MMLSTSESIYEKCIQGGVGYRLSLSERRDDRLENGPCHMSGDADVPCAREDEPIIAILVRAHPWDVQSAIVHAADGRR